MILGDQFPGIVQQEAQQIEDLRLDWLIQSVAGQGMGLGVQRKFGELILHVTTERPIERFRKMNVPVRPYSKTFTGLSQGLPQAPHFSTCQGGLINKETTQ